ncbi:MAG: hypothetical protein Q4B51_06175 [Coriobacteriaceae bacterium]|nr:hypothetical protein [Coriobacteriaceae bacterium]
MCTSIVVNREKIIVGWNLDILNMEYRVRAVAEGVFIEILDEKEGWLPLFGANCRGDFVGMPTCWPYDQRSDPFEGSQNIMMMDIDLLLQKTSFAQVKDAAYGGCVSSIPGVTFMGALSDREGNVLHIVPGQGAKYYEKPDHAVLTNFSPFEGMTGEHPWMGQDRYEIAERMLQDASDSFDVDDCFMVLKAVSQKVCPTVVSMVFDATEGVVYWCLDRHWDEIEQYRFEGYRESVD